MAEYERVWRRDLRRREQMGTMVTLSSGSSRGRCGEIDGDRPPIGPIRPWLGVPAGAILSGLWLPPSGSVACRGSSLGHQSCRVKQGVTPSNFKRACHMYLYGYLEKIKLAAGRTNSSCRYSRQIPTCIPVFLLPTRESASV